MKLGPTGKFPLGKIRDDDKGELACAISSLNGCVVIAFGIPVTWLSCPPADARKLAGALIAEADRIDEASK